MQFLQTEGSVTITAKTKEEVTNVTILLLAGSKEFFELDTEFCLQTIQATRQFFSANKGKFSDEHGQTVAAMLEIAMTMAELEVLRQKGDKDAAAALLQTLVQSHSTGGKTRL